MLKFILKYTVILVLVAIGYLIVVSLWGFYSAVRPKKIVHAVTPEQYGLRFENVSFVTEDKIKIKGWFIPCQNQKANAIIMLHGYPDDKGSLLGARTFLHKQYHLLLIDFRYLGESEGKYTSIGQQEVSDLLAAIEYLQKKGIQKIGVWGFSMGGAVALMTTKRTSAIRAIVAEGSYANLDLMLAGYYHLPLLRYPLAFLTRIWGILFLGLDPKEVHPLRSAKHIKIPLLFIHSKEDQTVPFAHAILFEEALKELPSVQFVWLETGKHGDLTTNEYWRIENFFNQYLK